jgi:hypothetical protein
LQKLTAADDAAVLVRLAAPDVQRVRPGGSGVPAIVAIAKGRKP